MTLILSTLLSKISKDVSFKINNEKMIKRCEFSRFTEDALALCSHNLQKKIYQSMTKLYDSITSAIWRNTRKSVRCWPFCSFRRTQIQSNKMCSRAVSDLCCRITHAEYLIAFILLSKWLLKCRETKKCLFYSIRAEHAGESMLWHCVHHQLV